MTSTDADRRVRAYTLTLVAADPGGAGCIALLRRALAAGDPAGITAARQVLAEHLQVTGLRFPESLAHQLSGAVCRALDDDQPGPGDRTNGGRLS